MKFAFPESREIQIDAMAGKNAFPISCTYKNGVIKRALGAEPVDDRPLDKLRSYYISETGLGFAIMSDATFYFFLGGKYEDMIKYYALAVNDPAYAEMRTGQSTEVMVASMKSIILYRNGVCNYIFDVPYASCLAVRCGRVFAADIETGLMLRWSGEDEIDNWEEGISGAGHLYVDTRGGSMVRLYDFEGELVALREKGVTRFAVNGTPESFRVIENIILTDDVRKFTAALVGDRLIFCCGNDMLTYRNGKVQKLECDIFDDVKSFDRACSTKGRYYVLKGESKRLNKSVIYVYDVLLDAGYVIDLAAESMYEDSASLIFATPTLAYRLSDYGEYSMELGTFNFGTSKRKLLTEISADVDDDVSVIVSNGRAEKKITGGGISKLGMRGSKFSVRVVGKGDARSVKLKAEVRK